MTDKEQKLTQQFMHECFEYSDGYLTWKSRPVNHFLDQWRQRIFNSRQAGKIAGSEYNGYSAINFSGVRLGVHRAVFLLHHGYMPDEVDHIDGNPRNNRIDNLRAATHSQNLKNMKESSVNTSGRKGVYKHKSAWVASIRIDGKQAHLGRFSVFDDAVKARLEAEEKYYGEFCRG